MNKTNKIKRKLKNAPQDKEWIEEAIFRQENDAWLKLSFSIAARILVTLEEKGMTQKDLARLLACSPQYLSKIIKGKENLTLSTIIKLEEKLNIKLIHLAQNETTTIVEQQMTIERPKKEKPIGTITTPIDDKFQYLENIIFEGIMA